DPNDPNNHEYYTSAQNNNSVGVYFRKAPLVHIIPDNLDFYTPAAPPASYGVPNSGNFLNHPNNWGPQYRNNTGVGSYSIVTNSRGYRDVYFNAGLDHTKDDDELGYMLLVDAHSSTTLYFDQRIDGLCAGTRFEFSAWVKDVNSQGERWPRVRFDILDASNEEVLASYRSKYDDVSGGKWKKIAMDFVMPEGVNEIKLRISNAV